MGDTGLEPSSVTTDNQSKLEKATDSGGAESGADLADLPQIDPDLAKVIKAWSDLPEAVRAGILAMIRASATK